MELRDRRTFDKFFRSTTQIRGSVGWQDRVADRSEYCATERANDSPRVSEVWLASNFRKSATPRCGMVLSGASRDILRVL